MVTRRDVVAALAGAPIGLAASRLASAEVAEDGFQILRAVEADSPILGAVVNRVPIWGYDGQCPGPVLRVMQGSALKVRLINELDRPTTAHWHGIAVPNAMDGTSLTQEPIKPGESFDYVFTPMQAGTYWYHSQFRPEVQVDRGLYGALIVDEVGHSDHDEIIAVIDDWLIDASGRLDDLRRDLMAAAHEGRLGNWLTVNGVPRPRFQATANRRVRLRLINAANARIMSLVFKGAASWVAALDGHPIAPVRLVDDPLTLAPGQRADVILAKSQDEITITNETAGEPLEIASIMRSGRSDGEDVAEPSSRTGHGHADSQSGRAGGDGDDRGRRRRRAPAGAHRWTRAVDARADRA